MVDCTLCSILSFGFRCIFNIITAALENPFIICMLSLMIALVFMSNIHTAKIICNFSRNCSINNRNSYGNGSTCGSLPRNFDYGAERGPHTWLSSNANQSPINIIEKDVQKFPIRELLTWNHYDELPSVITMENNGHTVVVKAAFEGNTPTLSGADLLASYTFVELCFRWSLLNNEGSEHMINYRRYPMELQAMHRTGQGGQNISSYDLLILAYFFDISSHNPYLDPIIQNLHRIQRPGTKIEIPPFPLAYLCYQFRTGFFSYGGSLTEPPCYQGTEWFVYPEPLAISERQLNEFRQLLSGDGKTRIMHNSRPVQNINESRIVNLNQYNPLGACDLLAPQESEISIIE
ncbi:putative carbonic anhydrase 3 [Haematobia irritans]|uniref:putative carbonic anhydrase 3 n=1 Tax=Haematobia irritans TaxID=7368 RepID=UPI003F4F8783